MDKNIIIIFGIALIFAFSLFYVDVDLREEGRAQVSNFSEEESMELVDCLVENDVSIYGDDRCPSCRRLVDSLGGMDKIKSIYTECSENRDYCRDRMETGLYPEIHIGDEVYDVEKGYSPPILSEQIGCSI